MRGTLNLEDIEDEWLRATGPRRVAFVFGFLSGSCTAASLVLLFQDHPGFAAAAWGAALWIGWRATRPDPRPPLFPG